MELMEERVTETVSMRVDRWARKQAPGAWKRIAIRDGSKGKIFVDILHRIIWLWDDKCYVAIPQAFTVAYTVAWRVWIH
ncbi:hypothetical protein JCM39068_37760 [Desulfocastanea catecholica]